MRRRRWASYAPAPTYKAWGCAWRSPDDKEITTAEEAQHLAYMHFAVCPTNPMLIQSRKERKEGTRHRRHLELEEQLKKANILTPPLGITEGRGACCHEYPAHHL